MQPFKNPFVFRRNQSKEHIKMNNQKKVVFLVLLGSLFSFGQQNDQDYITFNDRRNVVHGVYVGLNMGFGEIEGEETITGGLKIAYVANQQLEVGFLAKGFYSRQNVFAPTLNNEADLIGGYAGFHLEPILFGKSLVSLSFPVFIGGGAVGYVDREIVDNGGDFDIAEDDVDPVFVLEPGISALFNISRFVQLEAGVKYRFSSEIQLIDSPIDRINGFSTQVGLKVGIFNMGRNRYKKKLN